VSTGSDARAAREHWLSNVEMRGCDAVPCNVHISRAVWHRYRDDLKAVVERYPDIRTNSPSDPEAWDSFGARERRGELFTDAWGCVWENLQDGISGQVTGHPLERWEELASYEPPSPALTSHYHPIDWEHEGRLIRSARGEGALVRVGLDHGFFFQRLYYLRGFENLMLDIARRDPRLDELCRMVLEFNRGTVERYLELGVDVVVFGDDLGMQDRLTISPADWRRYVKPAYAELFGLCRSAGAHVYLHSDGYIVDIMPDLIEIGVTILNPQDLCNGLDNIRRLLKGRVCIDLDIDRQSIVPFGTPAEINAHIRRCIRTLASPAGGLMLICGIYPETPLENIETVLAAMNRYRRLRPGPAEA